MTRMLSDIELTALTIPRLQELLKAARARANAAGQCDCGSQGCDGNVDKVYAKQAADYVTRIKQRLHALQSRRLK